MLILTDLSFLIQIADDIKPFYLFIRKIDDVYNKFELWKKLY